ncbi:MAG TPA: hypothetical protein PK157_20820 [Bryobacteraceae bacterium]|nr:hypothetical protein [Bryobacteraceae bacterium]
MPRAIGIDPALLQAALEGLEHRLADTNEKIAEIKRLLRTGNSTAASPVKDTNKSRPRRKMSAEARKRIAEAQRRRWAEFRARAAAKAAKKGRKKASATEAE